MEKTLIEFTKRILSQHNTTPDEWEHFQLLKDDCESITGIGERIAMAIISEFGTAAVKKEEGFVGIGVVTGTDEDVFGQFFPMMFAWSGGAIFLGRTVTNSL